MGRRGTKTNRVKAPGRAARGQGGAAAAAEEEDLSEDLQDYLQNVAQQDSSDAEGDLQLPSTTPAALQPQQLAGAQGASSTPETAAPQEEIFLFDHGDPDSWRPTGLGYHHGFASTTAAAQFARQDLDHALEGHLADDMQGAGASDPDSSTTDSDSDSSSGSDSEEGSDGDPKLGGSSLAVSGPVVVDAAGRQQRWQDLSLQQRFPVQARHDTMPPHAPHAAAAGSSSRAVKHTQRGQPTSREILLQDISASLLLSNREGSQPEYQSDALSAAVAAATTAAASSARMQVAQYAELAQQLQQAKQNPNKRPGRKGKGVKKLLKKHKVAAKRNLREARSECGALQLLAAVERFVGSGQDVQVLPPAGSKQKEGFAKQLCRVFGVSASSQGGGSSGRTCLVLQATSDMQAVLSQASLAQLQQVLRPELAKELAAATIARDDTVASLKKEKKQRRRSSQQQQSGMQRQGSRGAPGPRAPTPDYQQPVRFVAAGLLDPNSSLLNHDEYMGSDAGGQSDVDVDGQPAGSQSESGTSSGGSSSGTESDEELSQGSGAAGTQGVSVGGSSAEVGAFLESLLLQDEGAQPPPAAAAATAEGGMLHQQQQRQQQQQAEEPAWFVDRAGSPVQEEVSGRSGLGFVAAAVAAIEQSTAAAASAEDRPASTPSPASRGGASSSGQQQQQQQQQGSAEEPPAPGSRLLAAAARNAPVPAWVEDRAPQRTQCPSSADAGNALDATGGAAKAAAAAAVPAWFEDRAPQQVVPQQVAPQQVSVPRRGKGTTTFVSSGTADDDFTKDTWQPPAAAAAAGASGADVQPQAGPMYDRAGVGLGFSTGEVGRPGLGLGASAAEAEAQQQQQMQLGGQGQEMDQRGSGGDGEGDGWEQAGLGRRQGRRKGASSGGGSKGRVAQLEAEFKSLQVPGGRTAAAAATAETSPQAVAANSARERRTQQRQQQRAAMAGGNLDAWLLAAGASAAAVDAQPSFNMTAQQKKQSKKKQQRNQRREAKAAAAAGGAPTAPAAAAAGPAAAQDVGFATFEVHTSGIGSRLLSRWGWSEGEGLGRVRQGRAEPIRAEQRAKNMGLGFQ